MVLGVGCSAPRHGLSLRFAAGIDPASVPHVDVYLLDRCPSAAEIAAAAAPTGRVFEQLSLDASAASLPSFAPIASGTYGLYARGFSASCAPAAAACTTVRLRGNDGGTLALELTSASGPAACAPATCSAGVCGGSGSDAGTDAGGGNDAGTDGGSTVLACTLVASADGFTSTYGPTMASGTSSTFDVFDSDGIAQMYGYLAFDPAASCAEGGTLPATLTVVSAKITLDLVTDCALCGHSFQLRRVTSSWTEAGLASNTNPSVAGSALATFNVAATGPFDVPGLATDIQTWHAAPTSHFGYRLAQVATTGASATTPFVLGARENATATLRPRLVIQYTSP